VKIYRKWLVIQPLLQLTVNRKSIIVDFFASSLDACTTVASLPLLQLGFLVLTSN